MTRRWLLSLPFVTAIARPLWAAQQRAHLSVRPALWKFALDFQCSEAVHVFIDGDGEPVRKLVFPPKRRGMVWIPMWTPRPKTIRIRIEAIRHTMKFWGVHVLTPSTPRTLVCK